MQHACKAQKQASRKVWGGMFLLIFLAALNWYVLRLLLDHYCWSLPSVLNQECCAFGSWYVCAVADFTAFHFGSSSSVCSFTRNKYSVYKQYWYSSSKVICTALVRGWYSSRKGWYSSSKLKRNGFNYISYKLHRFQLFMFSSFYIEFHELYWSIINRSSFITTDPDLNVIGCRGG